jgi:hypothetical protein
VRGLASGPRFPRYGRAPTVRRWLSTGGRSVHRSRSGGPCLSVLPGSVKTGGPPGRVNGPFVRGHSFGPLTVPRVSVSDRGAVDGLRAGGADLLAWRTRLAARGERRAPPTPCRINGMRPGNMRDQQHAQPAACAANDVRDQRHAWPAACAIDDLPGQPQRRRRPCAANDLRRTTCAAVGRVASGPLEPRYGMAPTVPPRSAVVVHRWAGCPQWSVPGTFRVGGCR